MFFPLIQNPLKTKPHQEKLFKSESSTPISFLDKTPLGHNPFDPFPSRLKMKSVAEIEANPSRRHGQYAELEACVLSEDGERGRGMLKE